MLYKPSGRRGMGASGDGGPCTLCWIEVDPQSPDAAFGEPLVLEALDPPLEAACFERLAALHLHATAADGLEAEGEAKALLARFFRAAAAGRRAEVRRAEGQRAEVPTAPPAGPLPFGTSDRAVRKGVFWLRRHLAAPDAIETLYEHVGLSRNHFRALFKQEMGVSARAYLTQVRMEAARIYLRQSELSGKRIARMVGYADPLYFSRHYRQFWGHPPSHDRPDAADRAKRP